MRVVANIGVVSVVLCLTLGCRSQEAAWALQHAEVTVSDERLAGYQTWEFYSNRWRRSHDEKYHICARVQRIEGVRVDSFLGCLDCDDVYELTVTEFSTDCEGEEASLRAFEASTHFGLGPISDDLAEHTPNDDTEYGWYVSWDSVELQSLGFAWPTEFEALSGDTGDTGVGTDVSEDGLVLWPGYAWELRTDSKR